jgi:L-Lysine epsilon oxidase N-terminal
MALIQFRIHPSVGMARFGESKHWYFVGSEFPFFLQEQFPNLRPRPVARPHPATTGTPAIPDPGRFRDKDGRLMPQAARFRIFAYVYNAGSKEPYDVAEVTPAEADIDWTVTVANRKTVRRIGGVDTVDLNAPSPVTLTTTNPPSPATRCKAAGNLPNLAWVKIEKDTCRLHVIGNEGVDHKDQGPSTPISLALYQYDWFDPAADGPVTAAVKPKPAFLSRFPGSKYLIPGTKDPQTLPAKGTVACPRVVIS